MFDLNRPLHAYDLDKIKNKITVRNSKKGESFKALDNKNYTLDKDMCVIADDEGVLGLGGIIGGERSGTAQRRSMAQQPSRGSWLAADTSRRPSSHPG